MVLSVKCVIDGSTQNFSKSVTQNKITWKASSGCADSVVEMIRLTLTIRPETKVFLRYVDNIVRTVRGDTKKLLDAVNKLHPNLQFTLETTDDKNSLPFLHKSINLQSEGNIFCTWYQKPSDTGTILNYRSCTPLQNKKSIIQGTIDHLFRANSNWEAFHEGLTKNEEIWERNQYPKHWVGTIVKDTINQL